MPRVTNAVSRHRKHKKILKRASGFYGSGSRRYRIAKQLLFKSGVNATRGRKEKKRQFRSLWITRISAACTQRGRKYSEFINGLFLADIDLNRKILSQLAIDDPDTFTKVFEMAMAANDAAKA
jgi:large subunit ribosomal protein L20